MTPASKELFEEAIRSFQFDGTLRSAEPYGNGHINDTYLLVFEIGTMGIVKIILQRMNREVFTKPVELMENIMGVTSHLRRKIIAQGGDPERETLNVIPSRDQKPYYRDSAGEYWRAYRFITDATSFDRVERPEDFYESAVAFGNFANLLAEFDASQLYEVLPNFHNTKVRYENFIAAVERDVCGRAKEVAAEIEWVKTHKDLCGQIVDKIAAGEIPLRVTHNDTKLNNVMLDDETGKGIAVIDLDTVMPGSLCYDFGDSIRFGCNSAAEDEPDLSKVHFRFDLYETYLKGYLSAVGNGITEAEKKALPLGAVLMTYECGMRFLTDYLEGDTYFRTHREKQNLDRAHTQFRLVDEMLACYDKMEALVG